MTSHREFMWMKADGGWDHALVQPGDIVAPTRLDLPRPQREEPKMAPYLIAAGIWLILTLIAWLLLAGATRD